MKQKFNFLINFTRNSISSKIISKVSLKQFMKNGPETEPDSTQIGNPKQHKFPFLTELIHDVSECLCFFMNYSNKLTWCMIRKHVKSLNFTFNLPHYFLLTSSILWILSKTADSWNSSKMSSCVPFTKGPSTIPSSLLSVSHTKSKPLKDGSMLMELNPSRRNLSKKISWYKTWHWKDWSTRFTKKCQNWKGLWLKKMAQSPIWLKKMPSWEKSCRLRNKRGNKVKIWWIAH